MNYLFGSSETEEGLSGPAMAAFLEMERSVDVYSRYGYYLSCEVISIIILTCCLAAPVKKKKSVEGVF
jgi:hypothetical protein